MSRLDELRAKAKQTPMFERTVPGRTLILDADFLCYQAAATVKKLATAITRFQTLVETERFITGADSVRIHITPRGCTKCRRYDYPTAKPYQGNRENKAKPPLLEPLRDAIQNHRWPEYFDVLAWKDREADDGMMMDAFRLGDAAVTRSDDKDLRITPGPYWEAKLGKLDVIPDRFGWIKDDYTEGGQMKVVGHGTKFFWAQMLMGDTADNVRGIQTLEGKLCGPAGALAYLLPFKDEGQAANAILQAYADIQQDPLAEAQCLWLRRSLEDCAYQYLTELDLKPKLARWLKSLHNYHQEVLAFKAYKEEDDDQEYPHELSRAETTRDPGGLLLPWD